MADVLILCGQVWSGKTTYAKHLCKTEDYVYFDFDNVLHWEIQQLMRKEKKSLTIQQDVTIFLEKLNDFLGTNRKVVIDGWFSWAGEWEKAAYDNYSIWERFLALPNVKGKAVELAYCCQRKSIIEDRFLKWSKTNMPKIYFSNNICSKRKDIILSSGVPISRYVGLPIKGDNYVDSTMQPSWGEEWL